MDEVDRVLFALHMIISTIFASAKVKGPRHMPYIDLQVKKILPIYLDYKPNLLIFATS